VKRGEVTSEERGGWKSVRGKGGGPVGHSGGAGCVSHEGLLRGVCDLSSIEDSFAVRIAMKTPRGEMALRYAGTRPNGNLA
jgi:hypothetical protein